MYNKVKYNKFQAFAYATDINYTTGFYNIL